MASLIHISKEEVRDTKQRLWNMMQNPGEFMGHQDKAPEPQGSCNADCWRWCDRFKKKREPEWCPHCNDEDLVDGDQCCTGWCDEKAEAIGPSPSKILRLSFHDCFK